MIKKILVLSMLAFTVQVTQAAENPYEKNYKAQNNGGLKSIQSKPDTKIFVSNHKDDDNITMLESGYDMMGTSDFEAGKVLPELAMQHAKAIQADTVLVYRKYASKKTDLSKIEVIRQAAKTTGEVDASVLEDDEEQFKYHASYWAKLPMPLLGLHVIKLKPAGEDTKPEDGLKVLAVIRDSPAAKANLLRGDVLRKIGDIELQKPEELSAAARQYQGKTVEIAYERGGEPEITKLTLNSR